MALTKVKAGNILLTTPGASSNDVTPATTQYVTTALANLADSAPSTLNTLNELAAALGDDANFSTTVTNSIAAKLPLAGGTMTGTIAGFESTGIDDNADATAITIDSSENVGIGRTSITQPADGVNTLAIQSIKNGKAGAIQLFSANDTVSSVIHQDATGLSIVTNSSTSGARNDIYFKTSSSEKLRITEAGNVGIGTTSPSTTLDVTSPAASNKSIIITRSSGAEAVNLSEMQDYNALQILNKSSGSYLNFAGNATHTSIQAQSNGSTAEDIALNPYDGNVGIGTTAPQNRLEIKGGGYDQIRIGNNHTDNTNKTAGIIGTTYTNQSVSVFQMFNQNGSNAIYYGSADGAHRGIQQHYFYVNSNYNSTSGHTLALTIKSDASTCIPATKKLYLDGGSDTYIDEYSANEFGITTGGSRKLALSGGNLYHTGSLNSNHNFSDERLKENIIVIPNALEKVNTLRGITFNRKSDGSVGTGLIAQELETVLPEAVYESKTIDSLEDPDAEEYKAIRYGTTVGLLVEAIKELTTKLEAAEARIATLEK
jgi:hypothetical protein